MNLKYNWSTIKYIGLILTVMEGNERPSILCDNPNVIVTKSFCPYCTKAKNLLAKNKIEYLELNKNEYSDVSAYVKNKYNHQTYPMVFLKGEFIGGSDSLEKYFACNK